MDLNTVWFILVGLLLAGYALFDGFDLGVGALHLLTKNDLDRRTMLSAIGPVWDGNEVWLLVGGGALFAAFPHVYATVFSGFYMALMLLLCGLIMRAVSIEFRSKQPMKWWRSLWDIVFSISSVLVALLLGVALGNVIRGIPIGADMEFCGTFWGLLNPYALAMGLTTLSFSLMHGNLYLLLKTEGELHAYFRKRMKCTFCTFLFFYGAIAIATVSLAPHFLIRFKTFPWFFAILAVNLLAVFNLARSFSQGKDFMAFLSSCLVILTFLAFFAVGMYPNLVVSHPMPQHSLTIYNSASSLKTLQNMAIIACLGLPLVLAYTTIVYRVFRGKVKTSDIIY